MKKKHIPAHIWTRILQKMVEHKLSTAQVVLPIEVSKSTFYKKRKEFFNGGVVGRKPGNGARRKYQTKDYEQFLKDIVNSLPPVFGSERIWMEAKRLGAPFGQGVCYRMLRELGLLLPRERGRCRKRYEPLLVDGPNQVYLIDTTIWVVGRVKARIYIGMDACSRWIPCIKVFQDKTAKSTTEFYEQAFQERLPVSVHTDNGLEFDNRQSDGYLEMRGVMHRYGPSYTPEAQGLIERVIKTLKYEWLMWKDLKSIWDLQRSLDDFRNWYNKERRHTTLGYQTPEAVHFGAANTM